MERIQIRIVDMPTGRLRLSAEDGRLTGLSFDGGNATEENNENRALFDETARQLDEYFRGGRTAFDLPLKPNGTDFQRKVWNALREIPFGEIMTYGEIAARVGQPKACRAVGSACHRNPLAIVIPCHRVVGADGTLTGYGGGLTIKRMLLKLEREGRHVEV